jgi:hypothetical protein
MGLGDHVQEDPTVSKINVKDSEVTAIATALGEQPATPAWWTIRFLLRRLGTEKVAGLVAEALRIENGGGLLTNDGSRRRTLGGVFFHIAKEDLGTRGKWFLQSYLHRKLGGSAEAERATEGAAA